MTWSNKGYHQNFLLCNNEITACIADLFNSFYEQVYVVAFYQGNAATIQAIGEVANSIKRLWADNFCLQQWKIY